MRVITLRVLAGDVPTAGSLDTEMPTLTWLLSLTQRAAIRWSNLDGRYEALRPLAGRSCIRGDEAAISKPG